MSLRLRSDSSAARGLCHRQGVGRIRHMDAKYLWIQDCVKRGEAKLSKIDGEENPADIGTKPLTAARIHYLISKLSYGLPRGDRMAPGAQRLLQGLVWAILVQRSGGQLTMGLSETWEAVQTVNAVYEVFEEVGVKNHFMYWALVLMRAVIVIMAVVGMLQWRWYGLGPRRIERVEVMAPAPVAPMPPAPVPVVVNTTIHQPALAPASSQNLPERTPEIRDQVHDAVNDGSEAERAANYLLLGTLTVVQMKEHCRDRGLAVSGLRAVLLQRLIEHERSADRITEPQRLFLEDLVRKTGILPSRAERDFKLQASRYIMRAQAAIQEQLQRR